MSSTLESSLSEAQAGALKIVESVEDLCSEFEAIWSGGIVAAEKIAIYAANRVEVTEDPWTFGFTPTFWKSVESLDKKLQGRVLAAFGELAERPTTARGDTVKPLVGPRKGIWRYRIGDYRLLYEPKEERRLVVLHEVGARGSVYGDG